MASNATNGAFPNTQTLNEQPPDEVSLIEQPQMEFSNEERLNTNSPIELHPMEEPQNQQLPSEHPTEIVYDEETCPICLEPHVNNKSRPDCGHVFCYQCLVDWCDIKLECPLCKQPFASFKHSFQMPGNFQVYIPSPVTEYPLLEAIIVFLNPQPNLMGLMDESASTEESRFAFFSAIALMFMADNRNAANANGQ